MQDLGNGRGGYHLTAGLDPTRRRAYYPRQRWQAMSVGVIVMISTESEMHFPCTYLSFSGDMGTDSSNCIC